MRNLFLSYPQTNSLFVADVQLRRVSMQMAIFESAFLGRVALIVPRLLTLRECAEGGHMMRDRKNRKNVLSVVRGWGCLEELAASDQATADIPGR